MKVKCKKTYSKLTADRVYHVLEISFSREYGLMFRLIGDDKIGPGLHSAEEFEFVSNNLPEEWCITQLDGFFKFTPKQWAQDDFWERYFNCDPEAERLFDEVARKIVADEPVDDPSNPSFFPPWSPF